MENTSITCPPATRDIILLLQKWGMWYTTMIYDDSALYASARWKGCEENVVGMQDVYAIPCGPLHKPETRKRWAGIMEFPYIECCMGWALASLMCYRLYDGDRSKLSQECLQVVERGDVRETFIKELRDMLFSYGYRFSWNTYAIEVYKICATEEDEQNEA